VKDLSPGVKHENIILFPGNMIWTFFATLPEISPIFSARSTKYVSSKFVQNLRRKEQQLSKLA